MWCCQSSCQFAFWGCLCNMWARLHLDKVDVPLAATCYCSCSSLLHSQNPLFIIISDEFLYIFILLRCTKSVNWPPVSNQLNDVHDCEFRWLAITPMSDIGPTPVSLINPASSFGQMHIWGLSDRINAVQKLHLGWPPTNMHKTAPLHLWSSELIPS